MIGPSLVKTAPLVPADAVAVKKFDFFFLQLSLLLPRP